MNHRLGEWRISLLTTLGLSAALGCGGATFAHDKNGDDGEEGGAASNGGATSGGTSTYAGMATRAGAGGRVTFGGKGGGTSAGSGHGGSPSAGNTSGGSGHGGTAGIGGVSFEWQCENPVQYWPARTSSDELPQGTAPAPPADPIPTTGFVSCEGGWMHRPGAYACPSYLPRADVALPPTQGACKSDAECTEKPLGYCAPGDFMGVPHCEYGCTTDAQCADGTICVCGDPVGRCSPATCTTDSDCKSGLCAGTMQAICGEPTYKFACATPEETCLGNGDCKAAEYCDAYQSPRHCAQQPICGRPFLVGDDARVASSNAGNCGWQATVTPELQALDFSERLALAAHWSGLGLMEHASVAAFARFMLELLALGAPAELVSDTQRALGDEIAHTELCFGLARAYGGRNIGPGSLPIAGALDGRSRFEIVRTAFLEACIGETLAAVEARLACDRARDPEVRRVLARIAEDEARHAELGWRFVRWAITTSTPELRDDLCRALAEIVSTESHRDHDADSETVAGERLADHGLPSAATRKLARRLAFSELIFPWTDALLSSSIAA